MNSARLWVNLELTLQRQGIDRAIATADEMLGCALGLPMLVRYLAAERVALLVATGHIGEAECTWDLDKLPTDTAARLDLEDQSWREMGGGLCEAPAADRAASSRRAERCCGIWSPPARTRTCGARRSAPSRLGSLFRKRAAGRPRRGARVCSQVMLLVGGSSPLFRLARPLPGASLFENPQRPQPVLANCPAPIPRVDGRGVGR